MIHSNRNDWWLVAAFALSVSASLGAGLYWIGGPALVLFVLCVYPQKYVTTERGLLIHATLFRRLIPYGAITQAEPCTGGRGLALALDGVSIRYGLKNELRIAPADREAFLADLAAHTPHLKRRGHGLQLAIS
ncbi:MAG TPA: PH domain-containing protein [Verrucomicrobiae bacterium]|nr:PH domain-containing protein [Verrucomicrobiae bacterium]